MIAAASLYSRRSALQCSCTRLHSSRMQLYSSALQTSAAAFVCTPDQCRCTLLHSRRVQLHSCCTPKECSCTIMNWALLHSSTCLFPNLFNIILPVFKLLLYQSMMLIFNLLHNTTKYFIRFNKRSRTKSSFMFRPTFASTS